MKDVPRWLFASIADHFRVIAAANNIPYFVEGIDERSDADMQASHAELRVTGPATKEESNGYYRLDVTINFMLTSFMDMVGNAYELVQWGGILQEEMLAPIPIYKYGNESQDTGALLGCLRVKSAQRNKVQLYHFGQMNTTDRVRQSELDAVYEMWLTSEEAE
jgi:hypothetical protein